MLFLVLDWMRSVKPIQRPPPRWRWHAREAPQTITSMIATTTYVGPHTVTDIGRVGVTAVTSIPYTEIMPGVRGRRSFDHSLLADSSRCVPPMAAAMSGSLDGGAAGEVDDGLPVAQRIDHSTLPRAQRCQLGQWTS